MATLAALVETTRNILFGLDSLEYPLEDRLNGLINSSTETIAVDTAAMWEADDYAEFANGEVIRLMTDTTAKRGQRGTTAQAQADNAEMVKNPAFFRHQIQGEVESVVRLDLWPFVWSWHHDTLTPSQTDERHALDQYVVEVVLVYQDDIDSDGKWRPLHPGWWRQERQVNTTIVANSNLLVIKKVYDYDETVYITAKRRPHVDDLTNLSDEIADMVPWAAAARCLAIKSPQIKNAQHKARDDREGGFLRDYRGLMAEFIRQRDGLHRLLLDEVTPDKTWKPTARAFTRSW